MYIAKTNGHVRLICKAVKDLTKKDTGFVEISAVYKVQIKWFIFWITIKQFQEDEYADALDCYKYITNPYII